MRNSFATPHLDRYIKHMRETVLPFWAADGFYQAHGMFAERFDFHGFPVNEVPHRAMVQARQIFIYCHAARSGTYPGGGDIGLRALHTLISLFCDDSDPRAGVCYSIASNGSILSRARDSYTHAFVLFALAAAYRLSNDRVTLRAIEAISTFVDRNLSDANHFGLFDQHPAVSPLKAQNPLMHLLEAYLALHEAWPEGGFLDRASAIVHHFRSRMYLDDHGVLVEHYAQDWSDVADHPTGTFFEPGHQFEWAWLLHWYGELSRTDQQDLADALWSSACRHGRSETGLCFDEVDLAMQPRKLTHRLWPHTEGAKIAAVRALHGHSDGAKTADDMLRILDGVFLRRPFVAGWVDRVESDGSPLVDYVPASSLYHLYSAMAEVSRLSNAPDDSYSAKQLEK